MKEHLPGCSHVDIGGKVYPVADVITCYHYWQHYLDKCDIEDAIILAAENTDDPRFSDYMRSWIKKNKDSLTEKCLGLIYEWREEQDEALVNAYKTINDKVGDLVRRESFKHEAERR